ncbi:hypothetical protein JTB14_014803 [Gonioctena quinquepunctata]|nr:hypothetical protein JTB14_014803 [Gonioctena quinquepunctata]
MGTQSSQSSLNINSLISTCVISVYYLVITLFLCNIQASEKMNLSVLNSCSIISERSNSVKVRNLPKYVSKFFVFNTGVFSKGNFYFLDEHIVIIQTGAGCVTLEESSMKTICENVSCIADFLREDSFIP